MNTADIKDIATIALPFINPLVQTIIKPKLKELEEWVKKRNIENKVIANYWNDKFEDYLLRTYQYFLNINVLAFPNQQINIKDIYCPLSINYLDNNTIKVAKFDPTIIENYQKILISDKAGMGKSTLLKWIGLSLIETQLSIPILIELRKLNTKKSILDEIYRLIDPIEEIFDRDLILQFIKLGNFTIMLDGFDEIEFESRESVISDIKEFLNKANKNWYILTSRQDSSLVSFGEFQKFGIEPLNEEESYTLIRKYDKLSPLKISEDLIKEIKEKDQQVKEFLENPLLVSLLYKSYTYNKDIPSKKSTFYEEVYSALYKNHDLTKEGFKRNKKSGLDIYNFRVITRGLAYITAKESKVEYTDSELLRRIKQTKILNPALSFEEQNFMEDLESSVPIFIREGVTNKWIHKSVQDFFAAEFISNHPEKEKIIELIYKSKKDNYLNILEFLYELEYYAFRKVIIRDILDRFITFCDSTFHNLAGYEENQIRIRQAINFIASLRFSIYRADDPVTESDKLEINEFSNNKNLNHAFGETFVYEYDGFDWLLNKDYFVNFNINYINIFSKTNKSIFIQLKQEDVENYHIDELDESIVYLDNDSNSILNIDHNFDRTNALVYRDLKSSTITGSFCLLNYKNCKKLLKRIDEDLKAEESNDIFYGI